MIPFATSFFNAATSAGGGGATDPNFANVVLLLGFNNADGSTTFTDDSSYGHVPSSTSGITNSSGITKFGNTGNTFNGTANITYADADEFSFGSGDFTVEMFFNSRNSTQTDALITKWNGTTQHEWGIFVKSGDVAFFYSTTGANQPEIHSTTTTFVDNTWYHIAFSRVGNTGYLCFDGHVIATGDLTGVTLWSGTAPLSVAANNGGTSAQFTGALDEVRVTKGVGRYSGSVGSSYTVPTAAFPRS